MQRVGVDRVEANQIVCHLMGARVHISYGTLLLHRRPVETLLVPQALPVLPHVLRQRFLCQPTGGLLSLLVQRPVLRHRSRIRNPTREMVSNARNGIQLTGPVW